MARQARILSETGMYHVMFRGINKQQIFCDERDYQKMLEIIENVNAQFNIEIYSYCMMPNHVHLFVREKEIGSISNFMKRILSHYAGWFNFKYDRTGHLFTNRYKSIPIEDDSYFLALARYIHRNPLKAGIVENLQDYKYSSYSDYIHNNEVFTSISFLLDMIDENRKLAIKQFVSYSNMDENESFDMENSLQSKDALVRRKIIQITGGMKPNDIKNLPKSERYVLINNLMVEHKISQSALSRILGIDRKTLYNIKIPQFGDCPQIGEK